VKVTLPNGALRIYPRGEICEDENAAQDSAFQAAIDEGAEDWIKCAGHENNSDHVTMVSASLSPTPPEARQNSTSGSWNEILACCAEWRNEGVSPYHIITRDSINSPGKSNLVNKTFGI
jgi:hypothetical protein